LTFGRPTVGRTLGIVKDYPGLWECGSCGKQYDGNPDGTRSGIATGDIPDHCQCVGQPLGGSRPFIKSRGDENQTAARIVRRTTD
jgi:hypothetical protein